MEIELGGDFGPIAAGVGGGLAGIFAGVGWTTLAVVTSAAAVAAGVFVGTYFLAQWLSATPHRAHQWKLKYEDHNWVKRGTIGWVMLGAVFYPFIVTDTVDYDADKYKVRFTRWKSNSKKGLPKMWF